MRPYTPKWDENESARGRSAMKHLRRKRHHDPLEKRRNWWKKEAWDYPWENFRWTNRLKGIYPSGANALHSMVMKKWSKPHSVGILTASFEVGFLMKRIASVVFRLSYGRLTLLEKAIPLPRAGLQAAWGLILMRFERWKQHQGGLDWSEAIRERIAAHERWRESFRAKLREGSCVVKG